MRTVPVKYSAGPFPDGREPLLLMSISAPSATRHPLQVFRVPSPLDSDLRSSGLDVTQIVGRQFDGGRCDVLLQSPELRGAGDWHNPWLLGQQPRERDLRRCRLLPFSDRAEQIDQAL